MSHIRCMAYRDCAFAQMFWMLWSSSLGHNSVHIASKTEHVGTHSMPCDCPDYYETLCKHSLNYICTGMAKAFQSPVLCFRSFAHNNKKKTINANHHVQKSCSCAQFILCTGIYVFLLNLHWVFSRKQCRLLLGTWKLYLYICFYLSYAVVI